MSWSMLNPTSKDWTSRRFLRRASSIRRFIEALAFNRRRRRAFNTTQRIPFLTIYSSSMRPPWSTFLDDQDPRALRTDARVILLGDAYQLASVAAGSVLSDISGPTHAGTLTLSDDSLRRLKPSWGSEWKLALRSSRACTSRCSDSLQHQLPILVAEWHRQLCEELP